MARYIFDIETNGFLEATTTIHCLMMQDVDTGEMFDFSDEKYGTGSIANGIKRLAGASLLIGHNILKFDIPVINKLYPGTLPFDIDDLPRYFDTLVASRLVWTNLKEDDAERRKKPGSTFPGKLTGAHKLEAWGYRLGLQKGEYGKDEKGNQVEGCWEFWNQEMHDYCILDVKVTAKLYAAILKAAFDPRSLTLEHEFSFVLAKQEARGFAFNEAKAGVLYAKLVARRQILAAQLKEVFLPEVIPEVFIPKRPNKKLGYLAGVPFTKYHTVEFNPSSRQQVARRLIAMGWEPVEFTEAGQAKVDETVLSGLPYPEAAVLAEYYTVEKRIGQLAEGDQAWLKLVRKGRIHGAINPNGAVTGRCTHSNPNVGQVPSCGAPYGEECRELFEASPGMVLVGVDLAGLELRCLAHFMALYDGGLYGKALLEGDVHWLNTTAMGLIQAERDKASKLHSVLRDGAKTFIYGFLYGCGDHKAGTIVYDIVLALKGFGLPWEELAMQFFGTLDKPTDDQFAAAGKKLKGSFLRKTPALKKLKEAVAAKAKEHKRIRGLDGRWLFCRSAHSSLNVLLQSAGALIAKVATVLAYRKLSSQGYVFGRDWALVAHVHDEMQIEAKPAIAKRVGELVVEAMEEAGRHFNFRIPITGEAKTGANWKETH